jgi:hypothetical protein
VSTVLLCATNPAVNRTERPEWALVKTGLFGTKSTFVPIGEASPSGDKVREPVTDGNVADTGAAR